MVPAIFTLLRLCPRTFAPASYLVSLSLSLFLSRAIFDPYPSLTRSHTHPQHPKRRGKEREQPKRKEKGGGNLPTSRIALISHPCEIASAAHLPDDWQPLFLSFSHPLSSPPSSSFPLQSWSLLPFALTALPPRLLVSSKLDGPMKFAARHFYLASLSLSLVPFSQSPSLGERPIPLEDPLSRRNLGHTRAREERKTERRFRTILERSSISYERCRSPLAYKTFIKSRRNELAAGADDAHGGTGNRQQLAVRWSSNSSGLFQPIPLLPIPPPVGKFSDADGVAWLKVIE